MACTTKKSKTAPVTLKQAIRGSLGKVVEKYYIIIERCGTIGSFTFKTSIYRNSDDKNIGATTSNGGIVLTGLEGLEKLEEKMIKRQIRGLLKKASNYPIGTNISHNERTAYLNQLGLQNVAKGSKNTGGYYVKDGIVYDSLTNQPIVTGGDGVETDPFDPGDFAFEDININIEGRDFREEYEDLSYPKGLGSNRQDRIRFEQLYSKGRIINSGIDLEGQVFQREVKKIEGSVTLPIVTGIGDRNQVDWQGATLNPLQALGAAGALSLFSDAASGEEIGNAFKNAAGGVTEALGRIQQDKQVGSDIKQAINIYLAQKAVGAQGLLSRATGAILNPNLEMLFNGPSLRQFGFTFKLSPRDADEATQVRKILRFFKQGMSVKTSSSNIFLKSPNIFNISYQTFNTDGDEIVHPSLNIIKTCALLSCDVQYTPDGTYMTYDDPFRTMTSYQLTLQFGELDPIYDSDYTELDNDQDQVIGY